MFCHYTVHIRCGYTNDIYYELYFLKTSPKIHKAGGREFMATPEKSEHKWYALRTFTGHEQKVKASLEAEIKRLHLEDRITEIVIPQETVFEVRNGKKRSRVRNFLPGYINLNDNTLSGMRHKTLPVISVQYHPEAAPGPHDSDYLFKEFVAGMMKARKNKKIIAL